MKCRCEDEPGVNGIVNITISTDTCSQCAGSGDPSGVVEGGVRVHFEVLSHKDLWCKIFYVLREHGEQNVLLTA